MQSSLQIATLCFICAMTIQCCPLSDDSNKLVTYDELEYMNVSCDPLDTCRTNRSSDTLDRYNCMCDSSCVQLDTCCADSPFANTKHDGVTSRCVKVYGGMAFYMVDTCRPRWLDDGLVEGMCKGNGEETGDPFLTIPVTSLKTGITYKNYFCSLCNEEQDIDGNLSFWSIRLSKEDGWVKSENLPEMFYNDTIDSWVMTSDGVQEPVTIAIKVPSGLRHLVKKCNPDLLSTCSANWTDDVLARKCGAYMATVIFRKEDGDVVWYKNPHCALCNQEDVLERSCMEMTTGIRFKPGGMQDVLFVGLFVLEDRKKKCSKDEVYDSFFKKCRVAKCAKGKVFRDGKCLLSDV